MVQKPPDKKLCHVSFSPFPADPRIRRYVNCLIAAGYKVFVICIGDNTELKHESLPNLEIFRLNISKKRSSYIRRVYEYVMFFLKAGIKSTTLFFKHKIKLFHTHNLPDFVVFTALIPKIFGAKIIFDMHELTPEAMMMRENIGENSFIVRLSKFIEKISVKTANFHITIHDIASDILSARNKTEFVQIINGVEIKELAGLERKPGNDFNIVYHGTINPNLNLGLILDALNVIKQTMGAEEFSKMKFVLYGTGPSLTGLIDKAEKLGLGNNFSYKGALKHDEMLNELCTASLSVYPPLNNIYTEICYPIKITELINLGIPVIVSRYKTICYYYPEECFFYFDAGDINGLVKQILSVKNNPVLVSEKVKAAKEAYKKVSWEDIMKKRYLDLIESAFAKP